MPLLFLTALIFLLSSVSNLDIQDYDSALYQAVIGLGILSYLGYKSNNHKHTKQKTTYCPIRKTKY